MANLIKWNRKDYARLSWAIRNFNNKISEIKTEENKNYLPNIYNYRDVKGSIQTRSELNRVIKALNKFKQAGQEELIKTDSGMELTQWEYKELLNNRRIAKRRLQKELKEYNAPNEQGVTLAQMGIDEVEQIKAELKRLEALENLTGEKFIRMKNTLKNIGVLDYKMRKALVYRRNYEKALEEIKNFKNYDKLKNYLDRIQNPIKFYEYISQNAILSDLFIWYNSKTHNLQYGGFMSDEEAFDTALEEMGLLKN